LPENSIARLQALIEGYWSRPVVWPAYKELMLQALLPNRDDPTRAGNSSSDWLKLPALCCQAAGGDPLLADRVTAAWLLFYKAAHLMDSAQDGDEPEPWWADLGPGGALSAATGLFFTASAILDDLHQAPLPIETSTAIVRFFSDRLLTMGSGQYLDLAQPRLSLEQYWRVSEAKSGAFFGLACWAGARLATSCTETLDCYYRLGKHLGVLIQLSDDLDEQRPSGPAAGGEMRLPGPRSLPVVYALEVLPAEAKERLSALLFNTPHNRAAEEEIRECIDGSGAGLYLLAEFSRHQHWALAALQEAGGLAPASETLASLLDRFNPARYFPA
jgi:geranylgeranyl pyrophosphate synthase